MSLTDWLIARRQKKQAKYVNQWQSTEPNPMERGRIAFGVAIREFDLAAFAEGYTIKSIHAERQVTDDGDYWSIAFEV